MSSAIGVPVVSPSKTPERIFTASGSRRWVVKRDWPGLRRSSQCCRSSGARAMPGGTPSTTQPMAGPWLSPQVVKRKVSPKLLPAIGGAPRGRWSAASGLRREVLQQLGQLRRRLDRHHADDVVAGIDVMHFTGDAGRQVGQQVEAGAADLRDADVLAQRRVQLVPLRSEEHKSELPYLMRI